MTTALIGATGFVGTTLQQQTRFEQGFHSRNIADIRGQAFDLVVCAGAPAAKWKANQDPAGDWANLQNLISHLDTIQAREFILISTVDVFRVPLGVDESSPIDLDGLHAYGANRYRLEEWVRGRFPHSQVVRLVGLFGTGLKKNFLFDLIHQGQSPWTHADSVFQFYDMSRLWGDLQTVRASGLPLVHLATEPVRAGDVAQQVFGLTYTHQTEAAPVRYDLRTQYAHRFGQSGSYIATQAEIMAQIRAFAESEQTAS